MEGGTRWTRTRGGSDTSAASPIAPLSAVSPSLDSPTALSAVARLSGLAVGCFADSSAVGSLAVARLADKRSRHCADRQQLIDNWGSKKKNSKVPIHARQRLGGTSLSEEGLWGGL